MNSRFLRFSSLVAMLALGVSVQGGAVEQRTEQRGVAQVRRYRGTKGNVAAGGQAQLLAAARGVVE